MNDSSCAPAHNAPLPLRRSPPASFKRMLGRGFLARTPPPSPIRRDLDASAHQQDDRRTAGKHGETQVALVPSTLGIQLDSQRSGHIACRHDPFACLHALCEGIATSPGEIVGSVAIRSEEHTSELQSPDHLVCRLLLEKKKKKKEKQITITNT